MQALAELKNDMQKLKAEKILVLGVAMMTSPLRLCKEMQTGRLCMCLVQTRPMGFLVLLQIQQYIVFSVMTVTLRRRGCMVVSSCSVLRLLILRMKYLLRLTGRLLTW